MINYIDEQIQKWNGKTCVLRADLNIDEGGEGHSYKMKFAASTIAYLLKNNIKVIVLSHRGRQPKEGSGLTPLSLELLAEPLSRMIGEKVDFIKSLDVCKVNFDNVKSLSRDSKEKVVLVENLRWHKEEVENDDVFAKQLAWLGDFYVNDAFSVSHRNHASVSAITKYLPSFGGPRLKQEIENLSGVMENFEPPLTLIIGGVKVGNKSGVIENFWEKADNIILGGGVANTVLFAEGKKIGKSIYDEASVPLLRKYINSEKIVLPSDFRIRNEMFLDIGERSEREFRMKILESKTIIWNGPMGYFEEKEFAKGSYAIANAIVESGAFSVVGGGETTTIISKMGNFDKFGFVSTGGGAMLEFLAGRSLPGIIALENAAQSKHE